MDGLRAVEQFLKQRPIGVKPSMAYLLDLTSIDYFRFQNDYYLQVKGTAMGSKIAPICLLVYGNF